jgi:phage terminase large subunit-like protein
MTDKPKKKKPLRGALEPRLHSPWLKGKTKGDQIAELAERIGQPLLAWQKLILDDMCGVDKDGMFIRKTSLLLVSRQSGKSHLARMRVLAGLFCFGEKDILIMSSNRSMAMKSFNIMADIIERNDFLRVQLKDGDVKKGIRRTNGDERIILATGAQIEVAAATSDGARGRTCDFLWIDELREVSEVAMDAAKSVTIARKNSQRLFTSNAGSAFSTVLNDLHDRCLSYPPKSLGFYEYSAPAYCDIWDREAWALANPSLGYLITEEAIEETIATSSVATARTETLCQWISSESSPWTPNSWEDLADNELVMSVGAYTMFGLDIDHTKRSAALVCGQILPDGRIGLALVQTWESHIAVDELQIAVETKAWCDMYKPRLVLYDKYTSDVVANRLSNAGVMVEDCSGAQFYTACATFKEYIDNRRVVHQGQEILDTQMNNCAAKSNDSSWRIIRRKSAGSVAAPISLAMVVYNLSKPQSKPQIFT